MHEPAARAIAETKARYCRFIDTKQWERLASLFTSDCRFEGLGSAPPGAGNRAAGQLQCQQHREQRRPQPPWRCAGVARGGGRRRHYLGI